MDTILDNIPVKQPFAYLKEKFQTGLTFPDSPLFASAKVLSSVRRAMELVTFALWRT
jgi:hypothetical protein